MDEEEIRKEIEPEGLPSLDDVRLRLRDLHFSETMHDPAKRDQLYDEHVDAVVRRGRTTWERVRNQKVGLMRDEEWEGRERSNRRLRPNEPDRLPPPPASPAAKAEREQRWQMWAVQYFEESSRSDDLSRIRAIGLTVERWIRILEREASAQAK